MWWGRFGALGGAVVVVALIIGAGLAVVMSGSAAATSTYTWTPYNLSSEAGGVQVTGVPSTLADPASGQQDVSANTPAGDTIAWTGDGADGTTAIDLTSTDSGPAGGGSPSAVTESENQIPTIFDITAAGALEAYARYSPSWSPFNISENDSSVVLAGSPSAVTAPGAAIYVATDSSGGDLYVWTLSSDGSAWTAGDVTSVTGQSITGGPQAVSDPDGYLSVFADDSTGQLMQFADTSSGWVSSDLSNLYGGQEIAGNPTPVVTGGLEYVFAQAPGGDLIEWSRSSGGTWTSQNLTTLTGGPQIQSDAQPAVVVDPDGGFDVFAESSDEHLIEYSGSGSSWSGTDLTAAGDGPTIESAPAATVSAQTGDVAVYAVSADGDLIEDERTPVPTTTTAPTVTTVTETVLSTPSPTKTKQHLKTVDVSPVMKWVWQRTHSELIYLKLGPLKPSEGFSIACHGLFKAHPRTGCPYLKLAAKGRDATAKLVKRLAKTFYTVGDVLTLTVSETGFKSEIALLRIRSDKVPTYTK
jgi:hypothetical protein